jgi:4-amino-4-deoxychorismate lyase
VQTWLVNGCTGSLIPADDRGLAYGDGLFETIALRRGLPRFLERHMARLAAGCVRLGIPPPASGTIAEEIGLVRAGCEAGTVKVIVTRGTGPRGYRWRPGQMPTRMVGFDPEDGRHHRARGEGVVVVHCRTPASSNPVLAGMKTLNRLDNVLARAEWTNDEDAQEGLMFDSQGCVTGGTMSNLFVVRDGRLLTPALTRCGVRGVMRDLVIEQARAAGIDVTEREIAREELAVADELFLTNALIGLWPVGRCGDRPCRPGDVTRRVATALAQVGVEECAP